MESEIVLAGQEVATPPCPARYVGFANDGLRLISGSRGMFQTRYTHM